MMEIQGKSILVRVSARFELARVRAIGNQLQNLDLLGELVHESKGLECKNVY